MKIVVLFLFLVLSTRATSETECFIQQVEWKQQSEGTFRAIVDIMSSTYSDIVLLELSGVAPVFPTKCHHAWIGMAWVEPGTELRLPISAFPIECDAATGHLFGLSSLSALSWGDKFKMINNGAMFYPSNGRQGFVYPLSIRGDPLPRRRFIEVYSLSPEVTLERMESSAVLRVCMPYRSVPRPLSAAIQQSLSVPRIIPIASCVHRASTRCGADLGWINNEAEPVRIIAHTDFNRLHPASIENGFTLPDAFAPGIVSPFMHIGWPCAALGDFEEAKWHLDGLTLHIDKYSPTCADKPADVISADGQKKQYKDPADAKAIDAAAHLTPILSHPSHPPKIQLIKEGDARKQWVESHVTYTHYGRSTETDSVGNSASVPVLSLFMMGIIVFIVCG